MKLIQCRFLQVSVCRCSCKLVTVQTALVTLSIRALSNVLDRLFLTIELAHSGLLPTLSAHDFCHTFADQFLAYLVEKRGDDLKRATDEFRRSCASLTLP